MGRVSRARALALAWLGLAAPGFSTGQTARAAPPAEYNGVAPESDSVPEHLPGAPGSDLITWQGFQMLPDGGSRVFLQMGSKADVDRQDRPGELRLLLKGLNLPSGNLSRVLDTRYFNTPVLKSRLKKHKAGVLWILELRGDVTPALEESQADNGYHFLKLSFPPGQYAQSN